MLTIDGSHGEGGGQILRSSLALSAVTGIPFRIDRIRANRRKPGLRRQHLTAVEAARAICGADVSGAAIGSLQLTFTPGRVTPGDYAFAVGTAGSTTLVLQAVLPALLTAAGPSRLALEGGTHNPMAPPFDFLHGAYLPLVSRMGPSVDAELERHGFHPAGGGRLSVEVVPAERLEGFELLERGRTTGRRATATVAHLPRHIAEREVRVFRRRLSWPRDRYHVLEIEDSSGPGNIAVIELQMENLTEVFTAFGQIGRPAETVAMSAVREYQRYLKSTAPVGHYLTDQLLLPLAIAGSGTFLSTDLSPHAATHIDVIRRFLDVVVKTEPTPDGVIVRIGR